MAKDEATVLPKLAQDVRAARLVGTPLIGVQTPDPAATIGALAPVMEGSPVLAWDRIRGLRGLGKSGEAALVDLCKRAGIQKEMLVTAETMLDALQQIADESVIYVMNTHLLLTEAGARQGIWNLRDPFKLTGRTLILLAPGFTLPTELERDVIVFDEPLPDRAKLTDLVLQQHKNAELAPPAADTLERAVDAVTGLAAFTTEQVVAMSLRKTGVDVKLLQERRVQIINQTAGLSVWEGPERFDTIGGYDNIKQFMRLVLAGRDRPGGVWWIDEISDQMAGSQGTDSSGVSQDQQMMLLTYMQNKRVPALLLVGHPGTGKSEVCKAVGNEAGVPTIALDLGGMQERWVGGSQERIRNAIKVADAVTAGRPLVIATCNDLNGISPQLRSRFRLGTFMFDFPTRDDARAIWKIHTKRLEPAQYASLTAGTFDDHGWTGREIWTCCDLAWRLKITIDEAARYIVPIHVSQRARMEGLRDLADGRFIDAAYPGAYIAERHRKNGDEEVAGPLGKVVKATSRRITV